MSVSPPVSQRLARHIEVKRDAHDPSVHVYIDGERVPYFFTGEGVTVEAPFGQPAKVTFTLTAERISVDDQYLLGQADELGLDHEHPAEERKDCDADGCVLEADHEGPCL